MNWAVPIHVKKWQFQATDTAQNLREYGFSLTRILPYKGKISDII